MERYSYSGVYRITDYYGNEHPEQLPELETAEFLRVVHRRPKEVR